MTGAETPAGMSVLASRTLIVMDEVFPARGGQGLRSGNPRIACSSRPSIGSVADPIVVSFRVSDVAEVCLQRGRILQPL